MNLEYVKREKHIIILKIAYKLFNNNNLHRNYVDSNDYE